jgi:hypothetical protein
MGIEGDAGLKVTSLCKAKLDTLVDRALLPNPVAMTEFSLTFRLLFDRHPAGSIEAISEQGAIAIQGKPSLNKRSVRSPQSAGDSQRQRCSAAESRFCEAKSDPQCRRK